MRTAKPLTVAILSLVVVLGGCMTVRPIRLPSQESPDYTLRIPPGRTVVAEMNDGAVHKFKLVSVDREELVGKDVRVRIADIKVLSVERASAWRTISLIVIGAAILNAIAWKQTVSNSPSGT